MHFLSQREERTPDGPKRLGGIAYGTVSVAESQRAWAIVTRPNERLTD